MLLVLPGTRHKEGGMTLLVFKERQRMSTLSNNFANAPKNKAKVRSRAKTALMCLGFLEGCSNLGTHVRPCAMAHRRISACACAGARPKVWL